MYSDLQATEDKYAWIDSFKLKSSRSVEDTYLLNLYDQQYGQMSSYTLWDATAITITE